MAKAHPGRVGRRLAAIVAADVAGYSRLMGLDEVGTARTLREHRKVTDALVAKHGGRLVKTTGDGLLLEFPSVVDAVECAVAVQAVMAQRNEGVPQDQRMLFRIGINLGDILIEGDDILGDGVNIAARLEGIAEPGGICISASAYDQVRGKVVVEFADLGEQSLKNISRPVRVYATKRTGDLALASPSVLASPREDRKPLPLPDKPSIAVLPFQNMSGDPEQEYFADGVVEDIITALSRFKSLFVIARNSSFTYKGKAVDIKKVGRELGVRYVLEGSVRKSGNRVRITGQLIDAESGAHIWADKFDGKLEDIFDLQDNITSSTVGAIAPKLQASEFERLKRKPTENLSAYDSYLRGLAKMYEFSRESLEEAIRRFDHAMELDPLFAAPCAAEAFTYAARPTFGWGMVTDDERTRVNALARRAAELDKDDAVALTYAGYALVLACHELDDGAEFIERATTANPNLAIAWTYSGYVNSHLGHQDDAIRHFKKAMRLSPLDPLDFATQSGLALAYFFDGQYSEALKWALSGVRANPNWVSARIITMMCYALLGDIDAAKAAGKVVMQLDPSRRISQIRRRIPLRRQQDYEKMVEAFRLAGIPE
jgi:TolB-like protein/class 3 adenylate cyclase